MKTKFLLFAVFLIPFFETNAQWTYLGLAGKGVTSDLTIYNDTIYAGTDDGLYKKSVYSNDTIWAACGMQGREITQVLVPDYQTFICEVAINTTISGAPQTQLFKSIEAGNSFNLMTNDTAYTERWWDGITHPPGNYDTLYSVRRQKKTYDGGLTWQSMIAYADDYIRTNPYHHNQLFAGGSKVDFAPWLETSVDNGNNWSTISISGFYNGDNKVQGMLVLGPNEWLIIGSTTLAKTDDGGNNWTRLINFPYNNYQWYLNMSDIQVSPVDSNNVYLTGFSDNALKVPLLYSSDRGLTWDTLSYSAVISPPDIGCMAVTDFNNGDHVFLGGFGVYRFDNILTVTEELKGEKENSISFYPNPAHNKITVVFNSSARAQNVVSLYDVMGRIVLEKSFEASGGENKFDVDVAGVAQGVYMLRVGEQRVKVVME